MINGNPDKSTHNTHALSQPSVLVADYTNKKVKLLDQQYQVLSHFGVTNNVLDMCLITPSEVAVAVYDDITQSKLVSGRKFRLQHECTGIAHYQGDLFICSGEALFKYTLSGKQTIVLLYIISYQQDKLLTLARDGTLLATYTDPALQLPRGQVLVCGELFSNVLQLATLATQEDGLRLPASVCYSSTTSSIIVGQDWDDNILDKDAEDVVDKDDLTTQKIKRTKYMCLKCVTKCMCVKCGIKCMCIKCGTKCMWSVQGLNAWTKCMCLKCGTKCMCVKCGTINAWTKCMCVKCVTKCMCVKCGLNAWTKYMCVKCGTKCMWVKCGTKCMCSVQGLLMHWANRLNCPSVSQYKKTL
ncbi:hypothetical protein DPMN_019091 [Dreissena polymorpha]|uniref:Uncharacterized protein n=1 Tax=Dreissena polymorpha TaxID=45954 RepID=A0A9D4S7V7_DREPO|nr:hypothetical protein DPMN_019091 [Dreissena polymorpha]